MIENFTYDRNINDYSLYKNLMLIDAKIYDAELFYNSANSDTFAILYNDISLNTNDEEYDKDNVVTQKNELVKLLENDFINLKRISIVSDDKNVSRAKFFLDSKPYFKIDELDSEDITNYSENLIFMIELIKKFNITNLDYLMCNSLQYDNWIKYYEIIKSNTGVIIGASTAQTGNQEGGGDWIMENTGENIKPIYFTNLIESYKSTLATTTISFSSNVLIRQTTVGAGIDYSTNGGTSWTPVTVGNFPIQLSNSTTTVKTVTVTTNIQFNATTSAGPGLNGYFIIGSDKITFDGANFTFTINGISGYYGLFENGDSSNGCYDYTILKNIKISSSSSTLAGSGGWIAQSYYGSTSQLGGNSIDNCSSSGNLTNIDSGGICGRYLSFESVNTITISNCFSTGQITGENSGGICGSNAGRCIISNCYSTGPINQTGNGGGGGICGAFGGNGGGGITIINCYSTGTIGGSGTTPINCGGICGKYFGYATYYGDASYVTNCYSTGNIVSIGAGGICGAFVADGLINLNDAIGGLCYISDCFSLGDITSINDLKGGICGRYAGYGGSCYINECYSVGNIMGLNCGGI